MIYSNKDNYELGMDMRSISNVFSRAIQKIIIEGITPYDNDNVKVHPKNCFYHSYVGDTALEYFEWLEDSNK